MQVTQSLCPTDFLCTVIMTILSTLAKHLGRYLLSRSNCKMLHFLITLLSTENILGYLKPEKKKILECYQVSHCRPRLRILAGILEVYSSGPKSIMVPGNRSLGLGLQSVTNVTELKGFVLATHAKGDTNRSLQKTK